jgi:CheY-like chemotaxis protein
VERGQILPFPNLGSVPARADPGAFVSIADLFVVAREGDGAPPAAALFAYALKRDLQEALASGFQLLRSKPIDPGVLIAAVAALAGTSGQNRAPHHGESRRS